MRRLSKLLVKGYTQAMLQGERGALTTTTEHSMRRLGTLLYRKNSSRTTVGAVPILRIWYRPTLFMLRLKLDRTCRAPRGHRQSAGAQGSQAKCWCTGVTCKVLVHRGHMQSAGAQGSQAKCWCTGATGKVLVHRGYRQSADAQDSAEGDA